MKEKEKINSRMAAVTKVSPSSMAPPGIHHPLPLDSCTRQNRLDVGDDDDDCEAARCRMHRAKQKAGMEDDELTPLLTTTGSIFAI